METEKTKQIESEERLKRFEVEGKILAEQERRKTLERELEIAKQKIQ